MSSAIGFAHSALNDGDDTVRELRVVRTRELEPVVAQESERGREAGSFIALLEGLDAGDAEKNVAGEDDDVILALVTLQIERTFTGALKQVRRFQKMRLARIDHMAIDAGYLIRRQPERLTSQAGREGSDSAP
jgi:hypothetical protein